MHGHMHEERMERTALLDRHGSRGELHSAPASGGMVRNNSQPGQMDKEMAWLRRCLPIVLQVRARVAGFRRCWQGDAAFLDPSSPHGRTPHTHCPRAVRSRRRFVHRRRD